MEHTGEADLALQPLENVERGQSDVCHSRQRVEVRRGQVRLLVRREEDVKVASSQQLREAPEVGFRVETERGDAMPSAAGLGESRQAQRI